MSKDHRRVEKVLQLGSLARPSLELLPVLATHQPEGDVLQTALLAPPGAIGDLEHLLKVEGLPCVRAVDNAAGLLRVGTMPDGGEIRRGVEEAAALLLHHHLHLVPLAVHEHLRALLRRCHRHQRGPVLHHPNLQRLQLVDSLLQHRVVEGFATQLQPAHVQHVVDLVERHRRVVDNHPPQLERLRVAPLQLDHLGPRGVLVRLRRVEPLLRLLVEDDEVTEVHLIDAGERFWGDLPHVRNQHAELRAPIPDVVQAQHIVPEELQVALDGVADDGRAQVADVHLLRDVRR